MHPVTTTRTHARQNATKATPLRGSAFNLIQDRTRQNRQKTGGNATQIIHN